MEKEPNHELSEEELSGEIANVLRSYGLEHGFDPETCDEIAAMPFPEGYEIAYGYLEQTGLNAEEILARFTEPDLDEE